MKQLLAILAIMFSFPACAVEIGIYPGSGTPALAHLTAYAAFNGRPATYATVNFDQSTWSNMLSDAGYETSTFAPLRGTLQMVWGIPMLPAAGGATLALCASGSYDFNYSSMAGALNAYGWGHSIVRIGWEFNGSWQPWAASVDPTNYVACYQRIVGLFRAVNPAFLFDWCPNIGTQAIAPDSVYPGDAYVDIIGEDIYDDIVNGATSDVRWAAYTTMSYGLQWQVTFAYTHGKRTSLPEWGCCGNSSGDDPYFILNMFRWLNENSYWYADYWDQNAAYVGQISAGQWPAAMLEWLKRTGG